MDGYLLFNKLISKLSADLRCLSLGRLKTFLPSVFDLDLLFFKMHISFIKNEHFILTMYYGKVPG